MLANGWSELSPGLDVFFQQSPVDGPFVLITAGIHGDEYEGPAAVVSFVEQLASVPLLRGSVAAIPIANPMAWRGAQRTSSDDGVNLARTFPGRFDGSPTERLASTLFEVARKADYLIDLHSGGVEYLFAPLCGFYGNAREENPSYAAAKRFGLPTLWQLPSTKGVLSNELWREGRCVIGCAYLGAGQLSPEGADAYTRGILSCLAHWKVTAEEFLLPSAGVPYAGEWQLAQAEGLFVARCKIGDVVMPGQLLADVRDPRGTVLQTFYAPESGGFVLAMRSKAYIRPDNWGVLIAQRL